MKGVGSSRPRFSAQGAKVLLFPRGPQTISVCSHPGLCLGLGDGPVGPKFLCLLMGFNVAL